MHVLWSDCEDKHTLKAARHAKVVSAFCFAFACVVGKNLKTPKLSPMVDDAITRGGIGNLVLYPWCISVHMTHIGFNSQL